MTTQIPQPTTLPTTQESAIPSSAETPRRKDSAYADDNDDGTEADLLKTPPLQKLDMLNTRSRPPTTVEAPPTHRRRRSSVGAAIQSLFSQKKESALSMARSQSVGPGATTAVASTPRSSLSEERPFARFFSSLSRFGSEPLDGEMEMEGPFLPPQRPQDAGKKTLVLDLDETLVCSSSTPIPDADLVIPLKSNGQRRPVFVRVRPYVQMFLEKLGDEFEIVVFTASVPEYANAVLNRIDPGRRIRHRLYREHCKLFHGGWIKDLSKLGRQMESIIMLDNCPVSYTYQPLNGVPCTSWYSDKNDTELAELIPFMLRIKPAADVRIAIGVVWEDTIGRIRDL
ncbi:Carboxy-terminal domain RNA polymerase II polypeptide A small phosphatase 1 [Chytriomyces hyalinus]|nr:Carboxy-terminal domain RNA polymerase II polypeptide A small phosphatase 1 [Chytriomyces hyalinus]